MTTNVDNAENRTTMGFAVNNAPLWLCKELSKEAKEFYNNMYYPVIVGWYRKAKQLDEMLMSSNVQQQQPGYDDVIEDEEVDDDATDKDEIKLFGGHVGGKN